MTEAKKTTAKKSNAPAKTSTTKRRSRSRKPQARSTATRTPATEQKIPTSKAADEAKVSDRDRPLEDTVIDVEAPPAAQAELERIRAEEDKARERQEAEAARDLQLKEEIAEQKDERNTAAILEFGSPQGTTVDERSDVSFGDCLSCGKPVMADEGYMKFPGGITHMHECARAYHHGLREQVAKSRKVGHASNQVRHPDVLAPVKHDVSGSRPEPLNVAQGSTALVGYGALADDAPLKPGQSQHDAAAASIETIKPKSFDTPIRDAVEAEQKATAEYARKQQADGEYVKNP